jgi:hypothetical protein
MRLLPLNLVAAAALIGVAPASAQLIAHPKCSKLQCREASQKLNLKHAKYLCSHGRHATKRWGCQAVRWLTKELNETKDALRPKVAALSHYAGWMCIHSGEGAWNADDGYGHYGGLQMTYGWSGRIGNAALASPATQISVADEVAREHGYADWWMRGQWPNTYPPCAGYF